MCQRGFDGRASCEVGRTRCETFRWGASLPTPFLLRPDLLTAAIRPLFRLMGAKLATEEEAIQFRPCVIPGGRRPSVLVRLPIPLCLDRIRLVLLPNLLLRLLVGNIDRKDIRGIGEMIGHSSRVQGNIANIFANSPIGFSLIPGLNSLGKRCAISARKPPPILKTNMKR